jgi:hypothetical protein
VFDEGFVPGAAMSILDVQHAAGHIKVKLAGQTPTSTSRLIAEKAARGLIVRRT